MKAVEQAKILRKAIANANMIGPKSKKDAKDPNQSPEDKLKASLKDTLLDKKTALEAKATAAEGFFLLYANEKMPNSAGTRLSPAKSEQPHGPIYKGMNIQDCITFHLLEMFRNNVAKQQLFYISNG